MDPDLHLREIREGLEIRLHVQPRAKRCEISGIHNGALKIKITAPPVDNAANRAVIEYFSDRLGIPKSRFSIISGSKSRDKVLQIQGISREDFHKSLALNSK